MPSLVGDRGQVLQVLGWALTRIHNNAEYTEELNSAWLCVEQNYELSNYIRGRGGASNACFNALVNELLP